MTWLRCDCGDSECPKCGTAQGTYEKESTMILDDNEDDSAFQPAGPTPAAPSTAEDGPTTAVPPEPGSDGSGPTGSIDMDLFDALKASLGHAK